MAARALLHEGLLVRAVQLLGELDVTCGSTSKAGDTGGEDSLEKGMEIHSSILSWRIP